MTFTTWDNRAAPLLPRLTAEQERVLSAILRDITASKRLIKIDGPAGSGKTTLMGHLVRTLVDRGLRDDLVLCAPTGKAADNLAQKTGMTVATVEGAAFKFIREKVNGKGKRAPVFEEDLTWRPRLLILDEASMISQKKGRSLVERCTGSVIAFGDQGQLPPIPSDDDPGEKWFVDPDHTLTENRRQRAGSTINTQALRIREHGMYDIVDDVEFNSWVQLPELLAYNMVITYCNADRQEFNRKIRRLRRRPEDSLTAGEPLMLWRNDKNKSVYNGTIVTLREPWAPGQPLKLIDPYKRQMHAINNPLIEGFGDCPNYEDFEARKDQGEGHKKRFTPFTLGYACTVHKAQGSEWDHVLIALRGDPSQETSPFLYTAVTRARQQAHIMYLADAAWKRWLQSTLFG